MVDTIVADVTVMSMDSSGKVMRSDSSMLSFSVWVSTISVMLATIVVAAAVRPACIYAVMLSSA